MQRGLRALELSTEVNPGMARRLGRPRSVLDFGCGAGMNGMLAKKRGAHVTGVEPDRALADRASRVLDQVFCLDPSDEAALQHALGQRTFDLVLIPTRLEQVSAPEALVRSASRYLSPGGRLIYSVRNGAAWPLRFGLSGRDMGFGPLTGAPAHFHSRESARAWAREADLELLELAQNPLLLKSLRSVLSDQVFASLKVDEASPSGFRDWSLYEAYQNSLLPFEAKAAGLAPGLLAYQHLVVARRKPLPGPLSLTVGMLTMDEEPSIARMISEIRRYAPDASILCVDSSVKDRTPFIAEELGARVLRQLPPRGHGPAMELLMYEAASQSDALIYLDCDFTYPAENIPKIREILESGADVVNAARIRSRPEAMPLANYLANKAFVLCAQALNGVPISDLHSGMRGYRASAIRDFSFNGAGDALPIDTLLWPARSGYHTVEIPIDYQERVGVSKLRKVAGTVWTFVRLARTLEVGSRTHSGYDIWDSAEGPKS
jgi:2-polyprenyl-3-methyl-5-hydroxy-6-metoxy-1,4-benzoquinol methylase